jgi:hypothetical protein
MSTGLGMDALGELLAIEEIKRLRARYFRYVDTKQWEAWGALFVDDCVFADLAGDFRCDGRAALVRQVVAALEGVTTIHHGHTPEIEIVDATHATGVWAMSDTLIYPPGRGFMDMSSTVRVEGYGHYVESYIKAGGAWRFADVTVSRLHLEHHGTVAGVHPRLLRP